MVGLLVYLVVKRRGARRGGAAVSKSEAAAQAEGGNAGARADVGGVHLHLYLPGADGDSARRLDVAPDTPEVAGLLRSIARQAEGSSEAEAVWSTSRPGEIGA